MQLSIRSIIALTTGLATVVALSPATIVHAQTFTNQTVLGTANLYGAGRSGAAATPAPGGSGGGTVAPTFSLTAGTNRVLTFSSVTGSVIYNVGSGDNASNPDGIGNTNTLSTNSYQGISGISFTGRAGFLTGVFINGTPSGYADGSSGSSASILSYTSTTAAATTFSPLLNQSFFIGDGLTGNGTGTTQQFFVPNGATALVLGFEDGPGYGGNPGSYNDNSGSFTASFAINGTAVVPEANTLALLGVGVVGIGGLVRRRFCRN